MTEQVEYESLEDQLHGRTIIILRVVVVVVVGGRGGGGLDKRLLHSKDSCQNVVQAESWKKKEQVLSTNQDLCCTLRIFVLEPGY